MLDSCGAFVDPDFITTLLDWWQDPAARAEAPQQPWPPTRYASGHPAIAGLPANLRIAVADAEDLVERLGVKVFPWPPDGLIPWPPTEGTDGYRTLISVGFWTETDEERAALAQAAEAIHRDLKVYADGAPERERRWREAEEQRWAAEARHRAEAEAAFARSVDEAWLAERQRWAQSEGGEPWRAFLWTLPRHLQNRLIGLVTEACPGEAAPTLGQLLTVGAADDEPEPAPPDQAGEAAWQKWEIRRRGWGLVNDEIEIWKQDFENHVTWLEDWFAQVEPHLAEGWQHWSKSEVKLKEIANREAEAAQASQNFKGSHIPGWKPTPNDLRDACPHAQLRRLRKVARHTRAFLQHVFRTTGGPARLNLPKYCDDYAMTIAKGRWEANETWARTQIVVRQDGGKVLELTKIIDQSEINRVYETMAIMDAQERIAKDADMVCGFLTVTLPSEYHSNPENGNYTSGPEHHPLAARRELQRRWALLRARIAARGMQLTGLIGREPHADGTPHAHPVVWGTPEDLNWLDRQLLNLFPEPPPVPGRPIRRGGQKRVASKLIRLKPDESASRYCMWYAIKGANRIPGDIEAKLDTEDGGRRSETHIEQLDRVRVWASERDVRRFDFLGLGGVRGVWHQIYSQRNALADPDGDDDVPGNVREAARAMRRAAALVKAAQKSDDGDRYRDEIHEEHAEVLTALGANPWRDTRYTDIEDFMTRPHLFPRLESPRRVLPPQTGDWPAPEDEPPDERWPWDPPARHMPRAHVSREHAEDLRTRFRQRYGKRRVRLAYEHRTNSYGEKTKKVIGIRDNWSSWECQKEPWVMMTMTAETERETKTAIREMRFAAAHVADPQAAGSSIGRAGAAEHEARQQLAEAQRRATLGPAGRRLFPQTDAAALVAAAQAQLDRAEAERRRAFLEYQTDLRARRQADLAAAEEQRRRSWARINQLDRKARGEPGQIQGLTNEALTLIAFQPRGPAASALADQTAVRPPGIPPPIAGPPT